MQQTKLKRPASGMSDDPVIDNQRPLRIKKPRVRYDDTYNLDIDVAP